MKNKVIFTKKVELLLRVLPYIMSEENFALKGGTAINLFMRNMPRLSVDIDLTYLPLESREASINNIDLALNKLKNTIEGKFSTIKGLLKKTQDNKAKQIVFEEYVIQVKVKTNHILRGSVYPSVELDLCEAAEKEFSNFI